MKRSKDKLVRVTNQAHLKLKRLARKNDTSITKIVTRLLKNVR